MSSFAGLLAGFAFVGLAGINVALALEASRAGHQQKMKDRLMLAHRVGGLNRRAAQPLASAIRRPFAGLYPPAETNRL